MPCANTFAIINIMNIQIFGTRKCFDTKKAERFFKERKIGYQFIDLPKYSMSKGELNSVLRDVSLKDLINMKHKLYKEKNLDKIRSPQIVKEIMTENPLLFNTPVVRSGKRATLGYVPDVWQGWIDD